MIILSVPVGLLMFAWGIIMILFGEGLHRDLYKDETNAKYKQLKKFTLICRLIGIILISIGIYILLG